MFKTRACASIRTPRRWPIAWRKPPNANIAFFVLDRPNPLGGQIVEGPMLDATKLISWRISIAGALRAPPLESSAQFFNAENHIGADLARHRHEELASQLFL